jgi:drug/metabolite transporter (DMT)-like permease
MGVGIGKSNAGEWGRFELRVGSQKLVRFFTMLSLRRSQIGFSDLRSASPQDRFTMTQPKTPMLVPILFALGTAMFWGLYGPTIGNAQVKLPPPEGWSPFKPYVFIGVAYLLIAIAGGLIAMKIKGDTFTYAGDHFRTVKWGFLAGCLGAGGALCLTTAMMISKGNATLVMPIVFGGAISVAAITSAIKSHVQLSPWVWVGISMCVVGAVIIARNQPHHAPPATPAATDSAAHASAAGSQAATTADAATS